MTISGTTIITQGIARYTYYYGGEIQTAQITNNSKDIYPKNFGYNANWGPYDIQIID